jgi:hypothetical protein
MNHWSDEESEVDASAQIIEALVGLGIGLLQK